MRNAAFNPSIVVPLEVLLGIAALAAGCAATRRAVPGADASEDVSLLSLDAPPRDTQTQPPDASQDVPRLNDAPRVDAAPLDVSPACDALQRALAAQLLSPRDGRLTCTVVVRLDYPSLRVLGYQFFCGRYSTTTEAQAREVALRETMYPTSGGLTLSPPMPEDAFVFTSSTGDFGGVAVVSPRLGRSVFGASIVYGGRGDITYPTTWRSAGELGSGCGSAGGIRRVRSYSLTGETAADPAVVDRVIGVVAQTAVPGALWQGGYVFDAVVLLYPRTIGTFYPLTAEWVVVVNGGWLE